MTVVTRLGLESTRSYAACNTDACQRVTAASACAADSALSDDLGESVPQYIPRIPLDGSWRDGLRQQINQISDTSTCKTKSLFDLTSRHIIKKFSNLSSDSMRPVQLPPQHRDLLFCVTEHGVRMELLDLQLCARGAAACWLRRRVDEGS
jgi:hypothetical protein